MQTRRHGLLMGLMGCLLAAAAGCVPHFGPVPLMPADEFEAAPMPVCEQQAHVYIFFINGFDPVQYGNLVGVRELLQKQGYINSYYGQLYHSHFFGKEMRRVFAEDPQARFVLVGFSLGAVAAYELAQSAHQEGLPVDLVIFIAGKGVRYLHAQSESPVPVVDIRTRNYLFHGEFAEPADLVREPDIGHFQAPTDNRTLDTLLRELAVVAQSVPLTLSEAPVTEHSLTEMLKPVDQLGRPGEKATFVNGDLPVQ